LRFVRTAKTKQDTTYCSKLEESWRPSETFPALLNTTTVELTHWLSRFVVEVRKGDGTEYPPNTLHHTVAGLQRYLCFQGEMIDLFKDQEFPAFWANLDREMGKGSRWEETSDGGD
jgi:hypothetical protein